MHLYIPRRKRRGVPEKHLTVDITITSLVAGLDLCKLDSRGLSRVKEKTANSEFEVVTGLAHAKWKSNEDRLSCKRGQELNTENRTNGENRWTDIQEYKQAILSGEAMPLPAVVHPSLTNLDGLEVIDGIRRFVAFVEAEVSPIVIAVIRRKACAIRDEQDNPG